MRCIRNGLAQQIARTRIIAEGNLCHRLLAKVMRKTGTETSLASGLQFASDLRRAWPVARPFVNGKTRKAGLALEWRAFEFGQR